MLQDTISSGQGVTDDKVLAAVLLLCTFKDISGEGLGDPSEHVSGLYFLLEMRGFEQLATGSGFELYILSLLRLVGLPRSLNPEPLLNSPARILILARRRNL
jgi:hypothetical protein